MKKAVFLDRDGTINVDSGYVDNADDFKLYRFAAKAIRELNALDFIVIVVTNQSGIARGYYTEKDLVQIHDKMIKQLAEKDAKIDKIYYSPYHAEGDVKPFNRFSYERKPGLGMFYKALADFKIDVKNSYMIGDKQSDIEFGKNANLVTILVRSGNGDKEFLENRKNWAKKPDFITDNLLSAVNLINKLEKDKIK